MTLDRINNLPSSIIETIMTLMPIRDAFRTSILSRKWRYHCINIPKLHFDNRMLQGSSDSELSNKYKFFHVVYHVLLLHHAPVLKFSLSLHKLENCYEIDRIILYLSRNTTLEKFTLHLGLNNEHRLPSTFFSLQKLTHLKLYNCEIQPLSTNCGFSLLTNLWFEHVNITMSTLLNLLRCCPLLKSFSLIHPPENSYPEFLELLGCLPLIEYLHFDYACIELPNMLVHLRVLKLDNLSLFIKDDLRSVLLLLTSSPNIKKINLQTFPHKASKTAIKPFAFHDYSYIIMDNLREMEITHFSNNMREMDLFILSKSPMLRTVRIERDKSVSVNDEFKILKDLLLIPRASTGAQIKFERPR